VLDAAYELLNIQAGRVFWTVITEKGLICLNEIEASDGIGTNSKGLVL
jgi:hypothetical protein